MKLTSEQLAYEHAKSVGWNEAVKAAAAIAENPTAWRKYSGTRPDRDAIAMAIRDLDRSMQAIDD